MKINVNDKVKIVSTDTLFAPYKDKVAVVKRIFTEIATPVAYVEIEDESTGVNDRFLKVLLTDLVPIEPKSDIPEGAREITKDDFDAAVNTVTDPENIPHDNDFAIKIIKSMANRALGEDVRNNIFKDRDSVIMTEDEFIAALWNACRPEVVANAVPNNHELRTCTHVSIGLILDFEDIIPILFGEDGK